MTDRHPTNSTQHRSTPGAGLFLLVALLIGIGAAAFALRGVGGGVRGILDGAGKLVTEFRESHETPSEPEAAPAETAPPSPDAPVATEVPASPTQAPGERPRAATQLQRIRDTVAECVPTLMQFAQNVRLIAADITPDNVDFVQESASVPGRFVRMSCDWDGTSAYNVSDNGRMVVPKRVGDPADLPGELLPTDYLDGDWLVARVSAAARSAVPPRADAVRRIELSYVQRQGVLTRVQFDGQPQRTVVVGPEDRIMPGSQFFPQVERFPDVSEESAARGYRDQGNMIYTQGLSGTLDNFKDEYFDAKQRYFALSFAGRRADVYVPATGSAPVDHVVIDEYGDVQQPERAQREPGFCDRPFGYPEARAALERTIKARGETLEQFEQRDFGTAVLDCAEDPRSPRWRLGAG